VVQVGREGLSEALVAAVEAAFGDHELIKVKVGQQSDLDRHQAADEVARRTNAQLEVIVEQMKALQERAREIVEQASRDVDLIHAECRFKRVAGRIYHLYERADGHRYFSMLGPDDYGRGGPAGFVDSFRYEHDESWTRLDEVDARDRRRAEIQGFASGRLLKS
jgi:hypothetical protein